MYNYIRKYTSKFCGHYLMELYLTKACKNSRNLFYKNISKTTIKAHRTIPGTMKSLPSFDTTVMSNKKFLNQKIFQNVFRRLSDILRKKLTTRKYFWNKVLIKNRINNTPIQSVVNHTITTRSNGSYGILGTKALTVPSLLTSSDIRNSIPTLVRTFATSGVHSQNPFAANYDFPVIPIFTKSPQLSKKANERITQNYMPAKPITDTRNESEKVYRKIRNGCKSLVTDLMYSFPFNTHYDADRTTKQLTQPKQHTGEAQKNPINSTIHKLSPTPRRSIWSITDKFSFPSIEKRFDTESFDKSKEDDFEDISTPNSSIAIADIRN